MGEQPLLLGIDVGAARSRMAWINPATGQAEALKNSEGEDQTPSVVYYGATDTLVGSMAEAMLDDEQERGRVVRSVKRALDASPLPVGDGRRVTPVAVAAAIIAKLKRDAEELYARRDITRAVVTYPAAFGAPERDRIAEATRAAGFKDVALLEAPAAAAQAYARAGLGVGNRVLVYDLGAGAFDLAVLTRESGDAFRRALPARGLARCGGDDFDRALYDYCDAQALQRLGRRFNLAGTIEPHILHLCKVRKENLSVAAQATVNTLLAGPDGPVPFSQTVTRAAFEGLIAEQVERTVRHTAAILKEAAEQGASVDTVVLIGGASRVPLVQRRLAETLPLQPLRWGQMDVAVALGAALHARTLWGEGDKPLAVASPVRPVRPTPAAAPSSPITGPPAASDTGPLSIPTPAVSSPAAPVGAMAGPASSAAGAATTGTGAGIAAAGAAPTGAGTRSAASGSRVRRPAWLDRIPWVGLIAAVGLGGAAFAVSSLTGQPLPLVSALSAFFPQATATPLATATPVPTATPLPTVTATNEPPTATGAPPTAIGAQTAPATSAPSASTVQTVINTDFGGSNMSAWPTDNNATIGNGQYTLIVPQGERYESVPAAGNVTDGAVLATLAPLDNGNGVEGVIARASSSGDGHISGYECYLDSQGNVSCDREGLRTYQQVFSVPGGSAFQATGVNTLLVVLQGTQLTVYLNGEQVYDKSDDSADAITGAGDWGVYAWSSNNVAMAAHFTRAAVYTGGSSAQDYVNQAAAQGALGNSGNNNP